MGLSAPTRWANRKIRNVILTRGWIDRRIEVVLCSLTTRQISHKKSNLRV